MRGVDWLPPILTSSCSVEPKWPQGWRMTGRKVSHCWSTQQPWRTGAWVPALLPILLFLLPEQKTGMRSIERWRCLSWGLTSLLWFSPGGLSYNQQASACCCPCLSHPLSHPQERRKAPSAGLALTLPGPSKLCLLSLSSSLWHYVWVE